LTVSERSVANGQYHVRAWEGGNGSPLLFLHGFSGFNDGDSFLQSLAESHAVVAPEHPGYGKSAGIEHIDDIFDLVLYYRTFIEQAGRGPVNLVGHSLGGMFAAEIAALCPQLIERLVLIAPFGLWLDEAPTPDLFVLSPSRLQRSTWHDPESQVAQDFLTRLANSSTNGDGIDAIVQRAMNLSTAGKFLWPLPDRGLRKRLPFVRAPTLVLVGESDGLVPPAHGEAFAKLIPNARLSTVPNAGHYPMVESEGVAREVLDFLGG
jgi:pimeloyl-ACP methyl ester carboxylesterase